MEEKILSTVILLPLFFLLLVEFETEAKGRFLTVMEVGDLSHIGRSLVDD